MLLDILLGNRTTWKILSLFAESPGKALAKKEIYSLTKIGNKVLSKYTMLLEKENLIISNNKRRNCLYRLNLNNKVMLTLLELIKIEKSDANNLDYKLINLLRELVYAYLNLSLENIISIYLFGSQAKRTARVDSDIDIAIITKKSSPEDELLILQAEETVEKRFKVKIQAHFFTANDFKKNGALASQIRRDGIKLFGA